MLKDGASAIYGTDAIGGVINFILRKDYRGAEVNGNIDKTEQGGGDICRASLLVGTGALDTEGYNFMASVTVDRNTRLSRQRAQLRQRLPAGARPGAGHHRRAVRQPAPAAGTALGANFKVNGDASNTCTAASTCLQQGKCDSVPGMPQYEAGLWGRQSGAPHPSLRLRLRRPMHADAAARPGQPARAATFKLNGDNRPFIEVHGSHTEVARPVHDRSRSPSTYPAGGAYYQDLSAYIPTFDKTKASACNGAATRAARASRKPRPTPTACWAASKAWSAAGTTRPACRAGSKASTVMNDGYVYNDAFLAALGGGKINPFLLPGQAQTQEATDAVEATKFPRQLPARPHHPDPA